VRREKIQNKPNFTTNANMPTSPHESRATGHESQLMQNEPNFNTKRTRNKGDFVAKSCKQHKIYPQFCSTFTQKYKKNANFSSETPQKARTFPLIYPPKVDFSLLLQTFLYFSHPVCAFRLTHRVEVADPPLEGSAEGGPKPPKPTPAYPSREEFTHSAHGGFGGTYKNMQNKPNFKPPTTTIKIYENEEFKDNLH
jgi:hypothetical protein